MTAAPSRLLLSGRLADDVRALLGRRLPAVDCRVVPEQDVGTADLAWADSMSGFRVPLSVRTANLRWFHAMSAGVDGVLPALTAAAVPLVTRTVGRMPERIAEYVLAALLAERQRLWDYARLQQRATWEPLASRLDETRPVLVLGAGRIGLRVASVLERQGFEVVVVARTARMVDGRSVRGAEELRGLARTASALVCVLPLTDGTHGLVNWQVLSALADAVVVNVGRGAVLNDAALQDALNAGCVRCAVLDVFAAEPLDRDAWVWSHPSVIVTPHVAGPTTAEDVAGDLVASHTALTHGHRPPLVVELP